MNTGGRLIAGSHNRNEFVLINADETARVRFLNFCLDNKTKKCIFCLARSGVWRLNLRFLKHKSLLEIHLFFWYQVLHELYVSEMINETKVSVSFRLISMRFVSLLYLFILSIEIRFSFDVDSNKLHLY